MQEEQLTFGEEFILPTKEEQTPSTPESSEPVKKDGRGRKKGGKNKPKEAAPGDSTTPPQDNERDFFKSAKAAAEKPKEEEKTEGSPIAEMAAEPSLMTGYILLVVCDAFIPKLVNRFIIKSKAPLKKLDAEQKKELKPLADAAAKQMFAEVNPVTGFLIAYGCITIANNSTLS